MRLLLDTHVLLWTLSASRLLPLAVRRMIASERNDVVFSVASLVEIAVKRRGARRGVPEINATEVAELGTRAGYQLIAIRPEHAFALDDLGTWHNDPFDRLLVSQAMAEGMRLLTHDEALGGYGEVVIVF
jgi:PIN domain nuclease of toxin-antitoxin system